MKKLVFFAVMAVMLAFSGCKEEKLSCEINNTAMYSIQNNTDYYVDFYVDGAFMGKLMPHYGSGFYVVPGAISLKVVSATGESWTWTSYLLQCDSRVTEIPSGKTYDL